MSSKSFSKKAAGGGGTATGGGSGTGSFSISNTSANKNTSSSKKTGKLLKKTKKNQEHTTKRTLGTKDLQQQQFGVSSSSDIPYSYDDDNDHKSYQLHPSEREKEPMDSLLEKDSIRSKKAHTISLSLLAKRCITDYHKLDAQKIMELLNDISHVRLDRENLQNIDGLELLGANVKNLYLQHNEISAMEGMETLTGLRFLTLSHNNIHRIQNIRSTKIGFLDLSHNHIDELDIDELPESLVILNLEGNTCRLMDGYREAILRQCPQLSQLDGDMLTVAERRAAGHEVVSSSDESDDDSGAGAPYDYDRPFDAEVVGVFDEVSSDIFLRCQSRIQHVFAEHKARVMNLDRIKAASGINTEDDTSNGVSRVSSRFDSPDTTDSSRPTTGNTGKDEKSHSNQTSDELGYRLTHAKMPDTAIIADKLRYLANEVAGLDSSACSNSYQDDDSQPISGESSTLNRKLALNADKVADNAELRRSNAWESHVYSEVDYDKPTMPATKPPHSTRPKSRKL